MQTHIGETWGTSLFQCKACGVEIVDNKRRQACSQSCAGKLRKIRYEARRKINEN